MSHRRSLQIPSRGSTQRRSTSGLSASFCTFACAGFLRFQTSSTRGNSPSHCHSRFEAVVSTTLRLTGTQLGIQLVSRVESSVLVEKRKLTVTVDLIDSMLIVDPERRFTVDQCLVHPWLTQNAPGVNDSTGGLVGGIAGLEVNRRAPARERTLLATLNTVQVTAHVAIGDDKSPVKVYAKNQQRITNAAKEHGPDHQRAPGEFMGMGGKGDQQLFGDDNSSIYMSGEAVGKTAKTGKAHKR